MADSDIVDLVFRVDGLRWKVRRARSIRAALNAIAMARVTGSIGSSTSVDRRAVGGTLEVVADVVRVNSDGTEARPYQEAY